MLCLVVVWRRGWLYEGDEEKVDVWGGCRWRGCLTDLPF